MAIPESQLDTWSAQGSVRQSAATYQLVKNVLEDRAAPYANRQFDAWLQGSYGNDTNIWADSDVDIVICTTEIFYFDTDQLTSTDKANFERAHPGSGQYNYNQFKSEVVAWLRQKFGDAVQPGSKAIFIAGNNVRRDVDVLVAAEHRYYWDYSNSQLPRYAPGIVFWKADGTKVVNYPRQHSENCTIKHQATWNRFKPTVRVFKNMRNRMIADGLLTEGIAPSYYIEGLLSNVPSEIFGQRFADTFVQSMKFLRQSDKADFTCANGIHYLLWANSDVNWPPANCQTFIDSAIRYWDAWR